MEEETPRIKTDEKGRFVEGTAPGPGRPKGSISIKDRVRQYLEANPEDVEEIVRHFVKKNRELMWQMLEGRPSQGIEHSGEITERQYIITRDGTSQDKSIFPTLDPISSNSGQS